MRLQAQDGNTLQEKDVTVANMKQFTFTDDDGNRYMFRILEGGLQVTLAPYTADKLAVIPTGHKRIELKAI